MKTLPLFLLSGILMSAMNACGNSGTPGVSPAPERKTMNQKLQIHVDGHLLHAVLYDNASAKKFLAQLPLTLRLSDFNGTEKIVDLPEKLPSDGAPEGFSPVTGDIAYYAPWGNLAIFYRDFRYSKNLILLGKIDGDGIKILQRADNREITIRLATSPSN